MDRFTIQADLFRDQFIGVLRHDLRTPLGAITAGATLLAVPEDNPQQRSRVVERIANSAPRMERMIGDLVTVARSSLGVVSCLVGHRCDRLGEVARLNRLGDIGLESLRETPRAVFCLRVAR